MGSAAERAYGLLWTEHGGTPQSNEARRVLLDAIGKDGQRRGIEFAQKHRDPTAPVSVTGIWLKRIGDDVIVDAEICGQWVEVIREHHDGSFSHIVEPGGMLNAFMRHLSTSLDATISKAEAQ